MTAFARSPFQPPPQPLERQHKQSKAVLLFNPAV